MRDEALVGRGTCASSSKVQYAAAIPEFRKRGKDENVMEIRSSADRLAHERGARIAKSTLVVVGFADQFKAEEVRLRLRKLQREDLIDLEEAVVAVKDAKGKVKLHQALDPTAGEAIRGGLCGMLVGMLFLSPLLGAVIGARGGTVSGALHDMGIDDQFMRDLEATMTPGSSALFVLVRSAAPDRVLSELKGTGGKILKASLSHEDADRLQAALSAARV
jgi:uncharacterized membrane protein